MLPTAAKPLVQDVRFRPNGLPAPKAGEPTMTLRVSVIVKADIAKVILALALLMSQLM